MNRCGLEANWDSSLLTPDQHTCPNGIKPSINRSKAYNLLYLDINVLFNLNLLFFSTKDLLDPLNRNNDTHHLPSNGTCLSKDSEQQNLVYFLLTNTTNGTATVNSLTQYLQLIANSTVPSTPNNTLTITQFDKILENITNTTISIANNFTAIVASQINGTVDNETVIGLAYNTSNNTIVNTVNSANVTGSFQSVAGIVRLEGLKNTEYFNMLLIYNPNTVERLGNWSETDQIVSSVVVVLVDDNATAVLNVNLYLQILKLSDLNKSEEYTYEFYDINISLWTVTRCTSPRFNPEFDRYECVCY
ncbi:unnamed protein product [Adineta ricciae]|uniref:Uncharacterized protein n=1 Tax=Adineta ricciae TaxID=249248 RepID=A0A813RRY0_ADIRI|nr:unnamed protein product [Adineta ricciae]